LFFAFYSFTFWQSAKDSFYQYKQFAKNDLAIAVLSQTNYGNCLIDNTTMF